MGNGIGIIFDLGVLLADLKQIHAEIEAALLASLGITVHPDPEAMRCSAINDAARIWDLLKGHGHTASDVGELIAAKWEVMSRHVKAHGLKASAGAHVATRALRDNGYRLAVASEAPYAFIQQAVAALGMERYFEEHISAEEVRRGKPAPDLFLAAASLLNVEPHSCVVIEETQCGMMAAQKAGMRCIGYVPSGSADHTAGQHSVTRLDEITAFRIAAVLATDEKEPIAQLAARRAVDEIFPGRA